MSRHLFLSAGLMLGLWPAAAVTQEWNSTAALDLVARAAERRGAPMRDGGLVDYRARASGFVFFLTQFGDLDAAPPRLAKADQLELEVYWRAPNASKQRIIGWRDRAMLPTDISYHRDHLGIIQNSFGDLIRLGEGDEVRDVVHPMSVTGPARYDYLLADSLSITTPGRVVSVYRIDVRPRDPQEPAVLGSVYVDRASAEIVRFRFTFTPASYLDGSVEDITIALEHGLFDATWWLPRVQEIEIRRRSAFLDFPARGVIRATWEIRDYEFNVGLADSIFRGPEVVAAAAAVRDSFVWERPLDDELAGTASPVTDADLNDVRALVASRLARRGLTGLPPVAPGGRSISNLVRFNRVEGLALGGGLRVSSGGVQWSAGASWGFADRQLKARLVASRAFGGRVVEAGAERALEDIGWQAVSGAVNSILAQEAGLDHGDYVRFTRAWLAAGSGPIRLRVGLENADPAASSTEPVSGTFRPNPDLGAPPYAVFQLEWRRRVWSADRELALNAAATAGFRGGADFLSVAATMQGRRPAGPGELGLDVRAATATRGVPDYRTAGFGGWGTLPGLPFRGWGGRSALIGRAQWLFWLPVPELRLGSLATTGNRIAVGPLLAAGWAGGSIASGSVPWTRTGLPGPSVGLAAELVHRLVRVELAWSTETGDPGLSVDVARVFWSIL